MQEYGWSKLIFPAKFQLRLIFYVHNVHNDFFGTPLAEIAEEIAANLEIQR
jgi:hypothetical protein